MFAVDYPDHLQQIDAAIAEGDAKQLAEAAHSFRRALSILHFNRAAQTVSELEGLGISGELAEAPIACERLRAEIAQALPVFEAQVALLAAK